MFVFTFSIAPKKYLHDAIANHKDKTAVLSIGDSQQLSNTGFTCKCDNLVAESPFIEQDAALAFCSPRCFTKFNETFSDRLFSSYHSFFELRGPPAAGV